jgi:two-component system nitrogen regulation sensor histidine kinase NtrY
MPLTDVAGASGEVTRLAALLDIEPELRAAEAGALRELLQVLSHEIMNALTPVASLAATAG